MCTNRGYPLVGKTLRADMKNFGERIRQIRTEQKLTVKELSQLCGVPDKTIYRIETGEVADPRISSVAPIIKALNCSADEVIFEPKDFPKFGRLRQLLLNFGDMEEDQQDFLMDVIQKISFSMAMERHVGANLVPADEETLQRFEAQQQLSKGGKSIAK